MLKLREGWEVRKGRWGTLMIGSARAGLLVSYDVRGECVRLYGGHGGPGNDYLCALDVKPGNWEQVAHAYFTKHKLQSPWENHVEVA